MQPFEGKPRDLIFLACFRQPRAISSIPLRNRRRWASKSNVSHVSRKETTARPWKPYKDYLLSPHASGRWQKKIRGKVYYFGRWGRVVNGSLQRIDGDGWQEALDEYQRQRDDLHAGRTPRPQTTGPTLADVCNRFLESKERLVDSGEPTARTFREYKDVAKRLVAAFGRNRAIDDITPNDFATLRDGMAKQWGPTRVGNQIQMVRTIFKFGYDVGLLDRPVRFGPEFKKPSASVLRRHRAKQGEKMLEAVELHKLIDAAPVPQKAMILLGINAGFGNHDMPSVRNSVTASAS